MHVIYVCKGEGMKQNISDLGKSLEARLNSFNNQLPKEIRIFFTCTSNLTPEGRHIFFFERNGNNEFKIDRNQSAVAKVWSTLFPEKREFYLVERMWERIDVDEPITIDIRNNSTNFIGNKTNHITAKSELLELLNPQGRLNNRINTDLEGDFGDEKILSVCRRLRTDADYNKMQMDGINEAFGFWVENYNSEEFEEFNELCLEFVNNGLNDPFRSPTDAIDYLTIWQNFSISFPKFSRVVIHFLKTGKDDNPFKLGLGIFFSKKISDTDLTEIANSIGSALALIAQTNEQKNFGNNITSYHTELWNQTKQNPNNKKIFENIINTNREEMGYLLSLAGKLAFTIHEGHPCGFTFIAGNEYIWPAISEIICFGYADNYILSIGYEIDYWSKLCEANYSLFNMYGVAGHYSFKSSRISRIINLRHPSTEDARCKGIKIADNDDLFCWALERIYEKTKESNVFIVSTLGNGKVLVYGLRNGEGDLLFIWDIKEGSISRPIENKKKKQIKSGLKRIFGSNNLTIDFLDKIMHIIRKISATQGEGACLVFSKDCEKIKDTYCATMEPLLPSWLKGLETQDPLYILKSAFVMDGATLLKTDGKVFARLTIYPHMDSKAWSKLTEIEAKIIKGENLKDEDIKILGKLIGKGSKTHTSCNLSTHPNLIDKILIVSISADGPIKIWPDELKAR